MKFEDDPSGLKLGDAVEVYPIDTGYSRRDRGKLVGLSSTEAVISTSSQQDGKEIRVHLPRWNFSIGKTSGDQLQNGT